MLPLYYLFELSHDEVINQNWGNKFNSESGTFTNSDPDRYKRLVDKTKRTTQNAQDYITKTDADTQKHLDNAAKTRLQTEFNRNRTAQLNAETEAIKNSSKKTNFSNIKPIKTNTNTPTEVSKPTPKQIQTPVTQPTSAVAGVTYEKVNPKSKELIGQAANSPAAGVEVKHETLPQNVTPTNNQTTTQTNQVNDSMKPLGGKTALAAAAGIGAGVAALNNKKRQPMY